MSKEGIIEYHNNHLSFHLLHVKVNMQISFDLWICFLMGGHMEKEPQDKRESNTDYHPEVHARDVNNREVFKNNRLASQFLRNYTGISLFSDIEAEDLEDVTKKYQAFLGVEFESDTIKKVYVHSKDRKRKSEIYVISLVEHKSSVDYDVAMQLLRYMSVIWHDYKVTQEKEQKGCSSRKNFRNMPEDLVNSIYGNAPKEIKDIFVKIIWSLLMKLNVPNEEAEEIVEQMRGGQAMGFLFENMDKMDIQAERRNTQREKERADKAEAEIQQIREKYEKENQQLRAEIEKLKLEQSNRK